MNHPMPNMPLRNVALPRALRYWAELQPDAPAVTFLTFSGKDRLETSVTYRDLSDRVDAFAAALEVRTAVGDRVALLLGQGIDYLVAFLACLRVGRIAVPLYPADGYQSVDRVVSVVRDCAPQVCVVEPGHIESVAELGLGDIHALTPDDAVAGARPAGEGLPDEDVAYLQYTSGSTRDPAGVMVTQANFAVGSSQLRTALDLLTPSTLVTWLPYFHDMGLLLAAGAGLQSGSHGVHFSPLSFVQQPIRWLRAISDYRASATVVPNFGLDLVVDRTREDQRESLDLSSLRVLANGSEPVRAASLRRFNETYTPHGFTPAAHAPGFGLAEATLTVTTVRAGVEPRIVAVSREHLLDRTAVPARTGEEAAELVSNGPPVEQQVRIVDPDTSEVLPEGGVGEVWVQGENVCAGYFGREDTTRETFCAELEDEEGHWLRTGDLGFLLDGEFFVAGRIKDLVIIAGRNHYPVDIEATIMAAVPEARANGVAVFAHQDESPVAVVELEHRLLRGLDLEDVRRRVRAAVAHQHDFSLRSVRLVRPGAIPKTTSGKIQRRASAAMNAKGQFDEKELA